MRTSRVKVRRDRPGALSWAIALVVTMLVVYLITLGSAPKKEETISNVPEGERVTKEVAFEALEVYCAQFGSFDDAESARIEAARFVERGAAGYVRQSGERYLVLGAGYAGRADAERVAERLAAQEQIECAVYAQTSQRVNLRITASEGQIDAVVAADAALRTQVEQLGELAFQIDRGELRGDAARTLMAVQAAQVRDILATLKSIPGENSVFTGLIRQVELLSAALEVLSNENSETDLLLSGKIKYNYISARLGYIEFLRGLK